MNLPKILSLWLDNLTNWFTTVTKSRESARSLWQSIPECSSEDALKRKEHDIEQLDSVLQDYLKIDVEVKTAMKLGKKNPQKTSLLKVQVSLEKSFCTTLQSYETTQTQMALKRYLYITPDLTPKQQEENKILSEKLNEMKKSGKSRTNKLFRRDGHQPPAWPRNLTLQTLTVIVLAI